MVNANGYPTRTRARVGTYSFAPVRLDRTHRFFKPDEKWERDRWVNSIKTSINGLSPATKRVLNAVRAALFVSYDAHGGYQFMGYVNRAAIARQLGRSALVPYDIRMLRALASKQFIIEAKRALPRKQYGDIWLGAGAEYVYALSPNVLFCLLAMDPNEQARMAEQSQSAAARAAHEAEKAKRDQLNKDLAPYRSANGRAQPKKDTRNFLEKIVDLLSW